MENFFKRFMNRFTNKHRTKGAFGGRKMFFGNYRTLKVVPRHLRDSVECNSCGVAVK